jgi:hypothetical protein
MDLTNQSPSGTPIRFISPSWPNALTVLFILILFMFTDIIFSAGSMIISSPQTDISNQFIFWRDFGFSELKKGNLALWNPHLFSGAPYLGGFQSALLYPLNFPYLLFPLGIAINLDIMLHLLLLGFFMYLWVVHRGIHPLAALLTGILIMFCGPHFLHIYAGHLSNLCAMTWVPLIFLAVDGILKKPSLGWSLLGAFAFCMQILAGHPQYVYYTCLAALIYVATSLPILSQKSAVISIFTLLAVFASGIALSAAQLLTGMDAARESVRSGGVSFSFAAMFSFPPENFLTLIAPYFFGDFNHSQYWGRAYLWEMNLFFGLNGLILAIYGLIKCGRTARHLAATILALLILALGVHTPLFGILFDYLPGFDKFRGTSKFIFFAVLFLIILSGMGLDALLKNTSADALEAICPEGNRRQLINRLFSFRTSYLFILFATILIIWGAIYLRLIGNGNHAGETWRHFLQWIATSGESYQNRALFINSSFIDHAAALCSVQLCAAALTLTITAVLWRLASTHRRTAVYGIFLLAAFEVFLFARLSLAAFNAQIVRSPALEKFVSSIQNDARILNLWQPNSALSFNTLDIWGYDPGVPKRYAEFIAFTQGENPQQASQYANIHQYHPLLKMLRLRYLIVAEEGSLHVHEFPAGMSRINLIPRWLYIKTDGKILEEMGNTAFDPTKTVILEKQPRLKEGDCPTPGRAQVISSSSDELIIEANLSCSAILLITDNYSDGWKVESLRKNNGRQYEIIRANYTLMAIPLEKGQHAFRIVYKPGSFIIGATVSIISFLIYAGLLVYFFWHRRRQVSCI